MLTITREFHFHAAHRLQLNTLSPEENQKLYGSCAQLHGHTYRLQVSVAGPLRENGMIIDFCELKRLVKETILDRYDHRLLNELDEFRDKPATAENMVLSIFGQLAPRLQQEGLKLTAVTVFETPTSSATITANA